MEFNKEENFLSLKSKVNSKDNNFQMDETRLMMGFGGFPKASPKAIRHIFVWNYQHFGNPLIVCTLREHIKIQNPDVILLKLDAKVKANEKD